MEEHTTEGDTDECVREHGTLVTGEPTTEKPREAEKCDGRFEDVEEDDWKDTHMESGEREQNTDTRYVSRWV